MKNLKAEEETRASQARLKELQEKEEKCAPPQLAPSVPIISHLYNYQGIGRKIIIKYHTCSEMY